MATYYVATNGSDVNPGTMGSPWSLAWAITSSNTTLQPGDTVILLDGTYTSGTALSVTKAGSATAPILYRALNEGQAIINAAVDNNAADNIFFGLRIAYLTPETRTGGAAWGSLVRASRQIQALAPRQRYIQCRLDNNINGMFAGVGGHVTTIDECFSYNNGVIGDTRKHGHGLYIQNQVANGRKVIRNNVIWGNFYAGQQWYGSNAEVTGITAQENGQFLHEQPDILAFTDQEDCGDFIVQRNSFKAVPRAEPVSALFTARDVQFERNTLEGNLLFFASSGGHQGFDNTVSWQTTLGSTQNNMFVYRTSGAQPWTDHTFDRNAIHRSNATVLPFYSNAGPFSLASWRSTTGYETNGSYTQAAPADRAFAYPSRYTLGRGHVHVWNWSGASSQSVDLGPILGGLNGFPFAIYHVFDFVAGGSPLVTGTYDGSLVTIPMDSRNPPTPLGGATPATMDNTFGVFVVTQKPRTTISYGSGL